MNVRRFGFPLFESADTTDLAGIIATMDNDVDESEILPFKQRFRTLDALAEQIATVSSRLRGS